MTNAMINRSSTAKASRGKAVQESVQRYKKAQKTATLLKQASDPTRLLILQLLSQREWHVGALCEEFKMSQPAVSHHLALLRHGSLIARRRQGKNNYYALTEAGSQLAKLVQGMIG
jgi:DNA-binding transcriptional ArsR family regulator